MFNSAFLLLFLLLTTSVPCLYTTPVPASGITGTGPAISPSTFFQSRFYTPVNMVEKDSILIPLKRAGRLLLIEAEADGEKGNLVFDTGASNIVFNSTYFRNHNKVGGANAGGITGDVGAVDLISLDKIEFAGLSYRKVRADMTSLGHIENQKGMKILGLIGFNLFRDFEIILDINNNQLKLFRIDRSGNRLGSNGSHFAPDQSQKISGNSGLLYLEGKISGRILRFCFDTGAETNVISSSSNKNILNTLTITRRSRLKGAGSAGKEVLFGKMNDFTFGNRHIQGMETILSDLDPLSEAYGTRIDGMLGYTFMEQGVLCINFAKNQFGIRFNREEAR